MIVLLLYRDVNNIWQSYLLLIGSSISQTRYWLAKDNTRTKARIVAQGLRRQYWTLIRRLYKFLISTPSQWTVKSARRLRLSRMIPPRKTMGGLIVCWGDIRILDNWWRKIHSHLRCFLVRQQKVGIILSMTSSTSPTSNQISERYISDLSISEMS